MINLNENAESDLVLDSYQRIRLQYGLQVCCEVPLLGRSVDLAYIRGRYLFTFEFKMQDWRKAIKQARDHKLATDYAYICMPSRRITERMREALEEAEVGLAFYKNDSEWPIQIAIKAPMSKDVWKVARTRVWKYIKANQEKV